MSAGRPAKYKNKEEVQSILDDYFETDAFIGEGDSKVYAPTITGLAMALGLSRQGLLDYSNKDEFVDTIKKAKQKVEASLEQRLFGGAVAGTIFNLKNNFGWKDQQDIKVDGNMNHNHTIKEQINFDAVREKVEKSKRVH